MYCTLFAYVSATCVLQICNADLFSAILDKGEFNINIREFGNCNNSLCGTKEIQVEGHLRKKSRTETVLLGNFTTLVPFDDNIQMEINFWKYHNERGFQTSPLNFKFSRACSDVKFFLGKHFTKMFSNAVNRCPLPTGTYIMGGMNIEDLVRNQASVLPPQIFYGRYKILNFFRNKKDGKILGCFNVVVECRPNLH